jgi:hypothetical protein
MTTEATASDPSLITIDEIVCLKTISQMALSPDGTLVAYVLGTASQEGEHPSGQIYLVSAEGDADREPRQFTAGHGLDGSASG